MKGQLTIERVYAAAPDPAVIEALLRLLNMKGMKGRALPSADRPTAHQEAILCQPK